MNHYTKKAIEFYNRGIKEYNEGLKERDTIKTRKGCEEIFHALVELSDGIITEHGYPRPEDHTTRAEVLENFGMDTTYNWIKERLHNEGYYSGIIKEKYLEKAIKAVDTEIKKRI